MMIKAGLAPSGANVVHSDLVNEAVLVSCLHHPGPVLAHGAHDPEDVNLGVSLEDALDPDVNGNQTASAPDASGAVDNRRPRTISHLHFPAKK